MITLHSKHKKYLPTYLSIYHAYYPIRSRQGQSNPFCYDPDLLNFLLTECGIPSARVAKASAGVQGLLHNSRPGDWPWHAALLRGHVHACDAALVHPAWLLTTASCFQVI